MAKAIRKNMDRLVTKIVMIRDPACVTCGKVNTQTGTGSGHLLSKKKNSTRWNLLNVHRQCWSCNWLHRVKDYSPYVSWFLKSNGCPAFIDLFKIYKVNGAYSKTSELLELEAQLQHKLEVYEKGRH